MKNKTLEKGMNEMGLQSLRLKQQSFEKVLRQLEKALQEPLSEYVRDATIQRFEFTYELAWKTLKAYFASQDITVLSPKETLQTAYQHARV